jgi:D-lactate dehydrogenase
MASTAASLRVVHYSVGPEERPILERAGLGALPAVIVEAPLSAQNAHLAKDADVITTFVHDAVGREVLGELPKLRGIAQRATGYDNIDLVEAKRRGIAVHNVPEYGSRTVAEYTFAIMLALMRKVEHAYERTEAGDFRTLGLLGSDLFGRTLAVVGGGRIGQNVARIAHGFGMGVVVVDTAQDPELAERLGFRYASLDDALAAADVVSLHLPYNEQTHHLIDATRLGKMKTGAFLVNTARGGVVDTEALLAALQSGKLGGAALDTFEGDSLIGTAGALHREKIVDGLRARGDVILTPHIAYASKEAVGRIMSATALNIAAIRAGKSGNRVV